MTMPAANNDAMHIFMARIIAKPLCPNQTSSNMSDCLDYRERTAARTISANPATEATSGTCPKNAKPKRDVKMTFV